MTDPLPALLSRLSSIPPDGAEYRIDGQTFRAILWHLREAAEYVAIERLELGRQPPSHP